MEKLKNKLSKGEILAFASGDLFGGGAQLIISFYYLIFLTDIVKIRPALAGFIVLFSKIWDAMSDPLMGIITDNTRSKWGRRKPYFLIGFFSILASFFLLWLPISASSEIVRFLYMLFAYTLYSTVSTIVMVPYSAMSSEISLDYKERNTVNGARLIFSQVSSLLCAVIPLEIVKAFSDVRSGYMAMAVAFGAFFAIPFLLIFLFTKERVPFDDQKSKFSLKLFLQPFKVRSFRYLIAIYLFAFLAMDIVSTVFAYYMNYYLKRPAELNFVLGTMLIVQVIMVPLVVSLANKIGKAKVVMYSIMVWLVAIVFMALLQPSWGAWFIYANAFIMGLGIAGCVVMPWLMYPDVTDVGELAFGKRTAGSFSGIMTFMRKFSSALGIFIVSAMLDLSGYIKPYESVIDGVTKEVMAEQPQSVLVMLKIVVVVIPIILLAVTFFASLKYPLNQELLEKIRGHLEFKKGNIEVDPISEKEAEDIKKAVI